MPIPDYESLMKPALEALADGNARHRREIIDLLAERYNLTPEERAKLVPSGYPLFDNRVSWALTYLKKAGLLTSPQRGYLQITERGKQVLSQKPERIDNNLLMQFEEFRAFKVRSTYRQRSSGSDQPVEIVSTGQTPAETLEQAYRELRASLITEILEKIQELSPHAFERLVVDVLVKVGYGGINEDAGLVLGGTGDEGIDGIIRQDPLGLENIYLQAKKWEHPVSRPEVQKFVGALQGKKARKGIFITSSEFTRDAKEYVAHLDTKVILIDGERLAELMFDYGVGVSVVSEYQVKRIDSDYFEELMGRF